MAEIEATIEPDGAVEGTVSHTYASGFVRTYSVSGTLEPGSLSATFEGSLLPNPMAAVPWDVTSSLVGSS